MIRRWLVSRKPLSLSIRSKSNISHSLSPSRSKIKNRSYLKGSSRSKSFGYPSIRRSVASWLFRASPKGNLASSWPPVPITQNAHGGGDEEDTDDRRVDENGDGETEADGFGQDDTR